MARSRSHNPLARRSFVSRLGSGLAALIGVGGPVSATAQVSREPGAPWRPTRHPADDWLDQIPGQHRAFFDASSPTGAGEALAFASNFLLASRQGYGLGDADNAVVICLRHWATPFAFTDAMWAKYGVHLSERIRFTDPVSHAAPTVNVYEQGTYGMQLPNRGTTLRALADRGVHFAVCDLATTAYAGLLATKMQGSAKVIADDLRANMVRNAHLMAAGVVAVNRAQERGYAIQHIG